MKVEKIMTTDVRTVRENDTMDAAVKAMWERDCGFVPVLGADDRIVGVITDRDVAIASWTRGLAPHQIHVSEAMSRAPECCSPSDTIETAEDCMRQYRLRRLPVVESDHVVGILSLNDLARASASQPRVVQADRLMGTIAAICEPHAIDAKPKVATAAM